MKYVQVDRVVGEIKFQKKEMIEYMKQWKIDEEIVDMAADYFDLAVHGIEDHMEHKEILT